MSNYTYHGTSDLIVLPGRSVQTYPSGLVRVERSFACRKADVARYRNILRANEPMPYDDGAPTIDGLFIFPEPQEQVRDDGFVEFRVTAYGRTNISGVFENSFVRGGFGYVAPNEAGILLRSAYAIMPRFIRKIVASGIPDFSFDLDTDILPASVQMYSTTAEQDQTETSAQFVPYEIWENYMMTGPSPDGVLYNGVRLFSGTSFSSTPYIRRRRASYTASQEITSVNFGIFTEYTITYRFFYSVVFLRS